MKQELLENNPFQQAIVGIVGLGYVGLPLTLRFVEAGFQPIGFDIVAAKVEKLKQGESYVNQTSVEQRKPFNTPAARATQCERPLTNLVTTQFVPSSAVSCAYRSIQLLSFLKKYPVRLITRGRYRDIFSNTVKA